ncbi:hypothetical protein [Nocardioides stalactiti]|uniref:hypothetical protein n=1 Tax=Nocardioides stalactiti TaxID=2755356 RepID=UPI00160110F6|nr:hypothetical protein [Nocardioides stalactiti]
MTPSPARGRAILTVLVLVIVACLGTVAAVVLTRGAGDGLGDKLQSLKDDAPPAADTTKNREEVLALSREFATRFNTYDASMLDEQGHLPEYAAVEDLMTPKFGGVFADNVGYAEQTVSQLDAASAATVYAVGVASQDADSAEVLVAGTIELSYPYPEDEQGGGQGGDQGGEPSDDATDEGTDEGEEDPRVSTGPQRFRYQLSLVKIDGEWLVDDLDDIDDGLPPFSQPGIPGDDQTPGVDPSAPSTESSDPSTESSDPGNEPDDSGNEPDDSGNEPDDPGNATQEGGR